MKKTVFDIGRLVEARFAGIPSMRARDFIRYITMLGFAFIRMNGDHMIYQHSDGRMLSVPNHREMSKGTLHQLITKNIGISLPEFQRSYNSL